MNPKKLINNLIKETSKGFIGNEAFVKDSVLAFCSGLHIIIDDISGVGKTTLVKSLVKASGLSFGRIQFTPDLLPGDITGMSIWDSVNKSFNIKKGPVFNEFILGDEINRASPRTQAALLEAMDEQTVTIDGTTLELPNPFFVVATKNPSYYLGTFELPESQLDRFGIMLQPGYPKIEDEKKILLNYRNRSPIDNIEPVCNSKEILDLISHISSIDICDDVLQFIVEIGHKTRNTPEIKYGISTRGLKHVIQLSQSIAAFNNRDFLIPEDVIYSSKRVIPHKIELSNEAIINDTNRNEIVNNLIDRVKIPIGIK